MKNGNEIILYQPDSTISLEVMVEDETVWLTQQQMADLFLRDRSVITRHIRNIFNEKELEEKSNVHFLHVANSDKPVKIYNLDVIISVGYRVKSIRGTQFRQWANKILKNYLLRGYSFNQRFESLEQRVAKTEEKIDFFIRTAIPPLEGVFFEGEIFDAYAWVCDRIKEAKKRIIVIDNYADYSVLKQLNKRLKGVIASVYTYIKNKEIQNDLKKNHEQYPDIQLKFYRNVHDRFLIIDDTIYHVGGSLKDLAKKVTAYSRLNDLSVDDLLIHIK